MNDGLTEKISIATLPQDLKERAEKMIARINALQTAPGAMSMQESEIVGKYIDWITEIPFGRYTADNLSLDNAKQVLDKHHYGLAGIKENILEFIATQSLKKRASGKIQNNLNYTPLATPVLCFVGVQGIGKTTMAKSIAESLGRSFARIPLGAFASVYEIRGKNKAESGAEPGQLIKAMNKSKSMNPVILLDEIDKVSSESGLRADLMAALLEILDPSQNHDFTDRYIDYPIDLSQVLFITTANNLNGISSALLDRLEIIRFHSYTDEEKQVIAQNYLMPKVRKQTGITEQQLAIQDDAWSLIIRPLGFDPGIRQLERNLMSLARKSAKKIVEGYQGQITVTPENFREFFPEQIAVMS